MSRKANRLKNRARIERERADKERKQLALAWVANEDTRRELAAERARLSRAAALQAQLCPDLLTDIDVADDVAVAITSFMYPNGDSVNLYFEDQGGDELIVTDEGATVQFLRQQQVELTTDRKLTIQAMCTRDEVEFQSPRLVKRFEMATAGPACMSLCETVTRVSSIFYSSTGLSRSPLPQAVDDLLRKQVEPARRVERKWVHRPRGVAPPPEM